MVQLENYGCDKNAFNKGFRQKHGHFSWRACSWVLSKTVIDKNTLIFMRLQGSFMWVQTVLLVTAPLHESILILF